MARKKVFGQKIKSISNKPLSAHIAIASSTMIQVDMNMIQRLRLNCNNNNHHNYSTDSMLKTLQRDWCKQDFIWAFIIIKAVNLPSREIPLSQLTSECYT